MIFQCLRLVAFPGPLTAWTKEAERKLQNHDVQHQAMGFCNWHISVKRCDISMMFTFATFATSLLQKPPILNLPLAKRERVDASHDVSLPSWSERSWELISRVFGWESFCLKEHNKCSDCSFKIEIRGFL